MPGSTGYNSVSAPAASETAIQARLFRLTGQVQGVGFRPFVYRLARRLGLVGWVCNDARGVSIHAQGQVHSLKEFARRLLEEAPLAAHIDDWRCLSAPLLAVAEFLIRESADSTCDTRVRIPPDRVACAACLADVDDVMNRRAGYPLTTCTECGPRYSIIRSLPYDRPGTTLANFPLCPACESEYRNPLDRRFHAQPIACPACGPRVWLCNANGDLLAEGATALPLVAGLLTDGQIVALKGLGGFQLLVRADSNAAVARLRERKHRPSKPLAVLVGSIEQARAIAQVDADEEALLRSAAGPIVLLRRREDAGLAEQIAPGLSQVGILLPTTPLHHLLLQQVDFPVVATSGNCSDDPIEIDETHALSALGSIADAFLVHDRPIAHRIDDSVARLIAGVPVFLRLARGQAPLPLPSLEAWLERASVQLPPFLAVGGQQKSAIALWTGQQAILGPHIGDLDSPATRAAFAQHIDDLTTLYRCRPTHLVCDLHPDYYSQHWAEQSGLPCVMVQHHHAHAAACLVEHDLLDREVLAFTWDGTGLGEDGTIWGGEVLRARLDSFERVATLRSFVLPGGEAAIHEPARVALALLADTFSAEAVLADSRLLDWLGYTPYQARALLHLVHRGLHCPRTTSMGRLFDALAMLLLGGHRVHYEGEAAAWLESVAESSSAAACCPALAGSLSGIHEGDWRPLIARVVAGWREGVNPKLLAWSFHDVLAQWAAHVARRYPDLPIVLGGGCFQNRLLVERLTAHISDRRLHAAARIPPGDGGLAVGQLAIALARYQKEVERVSGHSRSVARTPAGR
jgi:hydrogenase maturation protein HypF